MAEAAFQKALRSNYGSGLLGLATASGLVQSGYSTLALQLLLPWRQEQAKNPEFWKLLCRAAYETKQADWLLAASEAAYRLVPDDPNAMNNYAAALLISRQRPEEAIRLTVQLLAWNPHSLTAKVNHSLAMVRNGRAAEAAALLQTVTADHLTGAEANSLSLAHFEINRALGQWNRARQAEARLEERYLFPHQANGWRQEPLAFNQ
jgi:predicted Zn-dependent protease